MQARAPSVGEFVFEFDTKSQTAEDVSIKLQTMVGGTGLEMFCGASMEVGPSRPGVLQVVTALGDAAWLPIPWRELAGMLHVVATSGLPAEEKLDLELMTGQPDPDGGPPGVGMFLLQSFGRYIWKSLAASLLRAWQKGAFAGCGLRLHTLLHNHQVWQPAEWRSALGEAAPLLRGMHWCGTIAKLGYLVVPYNNYWPKVSTMVALVRRLRYKYIVSFDDDVMLPASALAAVVRSGPEADRLGCGVVVPLLQNGVPTVELWAETFLDLAEQNWFYRCFEDSEALYLGKHYKELEPMPRPWNGREWYRRVAQHVPEQDQGMHPVRTNNTCMGAALGLALRKVPTEWLRWRTDHELFVDSIGMYPYVLNNAFLMRASRYMEAISREEWFGTGADEMPMNMLIEEVGLKRCFVGHSFGLHPAYGTHPWHADMEHLALHEVMRAEGLAPPPGPTRRPGSRGPPAAAALSEGLGPLPP